MDSLIWGFLGFVLLPVWLLAGLVDYWTHQRTALAATSGLPESILHVVQTAQVGIAVLVVLFLELNLWALAILVAATVAHTVTAYVDVRYASARREILPTEQLAHAFLLTLPVFAVTLLVLVHWPAVQTLHDPLETGYIGGGLEWRREPWPPVLIATILVASGVLGVLPLIAEVRQAWRTRSLMSGI